MPALVPRLSKGRHRLPRLSNACAASEALERQEWAPEALKGLALALQLSGTGGARRPQGSVNDRAQNSFLPQPWPDPNIL